MPFKRPCPNGYNRTGLSHLISLDSSGYSSVLVSPVLVASAVIGMVVAISCVTIIVGSLRRDSRSGSQQSHRRRQEFEDSQDSEESWYWSHGLRYACSLSGDWSQPTDLSPGEEANAMALRELYTDSPPPYEECVGTGATQMHLPMDAPPPYSLTDASPSGYQPAQSGPRTISMDALPTYEAVCEIYPPSGLLPLPGPEPGPGSPPRSPERVV